jgi:hypothetical protein
MDGFRFDALTRAFMGTRSRRSLTRLRSALVLSAGSSHLGVPAGEAKR